MHLSCAARDLRRMADWLELRAVHRRRCSSSINIRGHEKSFTSAPSLAGGARGQG